MAVHKFSQNKVLGAGSDIQIDRSFSEPLCPKKVSSAFTSIIFFRLGLAFTPYIYYKQEPVTLRNLWSKGLQVIISYEHNVANCHGDLWSHIPYWWANKCKAEALIEEFERRKQNGRPGKRNSSFLPPSITWLGDHWLIFLHGKYSKYRTYRALTGVDEEIGEKVLLYIYITLLLH